MDKIVDKSYSLWIDGKWTPARDNKTYETISPATGEVLAACAEASKEDVDKAVKAAWKAFPEWKKTSPAQRSAILLKIADLIDANKEKLALTESMDNGKPVRETLNIDIPAASDHFRYFAGVLRAEEGTATFLDNDTLSIVTEEPVGVVAQIVPWNFPFLMAAWKLAPALAAGNCIVFKPSSETSLSVLELAKIISAENILPAGVLNILTGKGSTTGNYIIQHPDIKKLAFTGSTEVGYDVAKAAADKLIPATLELGGKSANIFFDDMPWDKAVDGVCLGILFNQGQVCCAGSRVFVQDTVYDKFVAAVKEKFEAVKIGLPWEKDTMLGSQISQRQLKKILSYIDIAKDEGASIVTGGKKVSLPGLENGAYMQPTILGNVTNDMRVAREEIFGPVVCFIKFHTEDEVIRLANANEYGLGGAVWTKDINKAFRVARAVETGRMWVNDYNNLPAHAPFGGYKKSGIGRETHKMILKNYTQVKNIFISMKETPSGLY
ncbi:aldehyde dehydrogenase family protein [Pectinatus haikarae]|uniref:Acyl-CoA reductase-like NAD-dependent aldehyde dehydrogenase n=1 Tax=Pectinatus haikarae TaxID=349096 RepID=A0ABT9YA53_9FIRM|nr:aldehyde dehydrogenase family protein [Pectinatus haikarae]MDQ0204725.1 acyl-CoA reductase-like NAD-dependent aldehyde dehydrogenase [Pectinatus haikarae]